MAEKFDPAPFDKYAPDPKEAMKADNNVDEKLKAGIVGGSFRGKIDGLIPSPCVHDPCAQRRVPMDMMSQGRSTSLFQLKQQ
jgi:hypothetical protein